MGNNAEENFSTQENSQKAQTRFSGEDEHAGWTRSFGTTAAQGSSSVSGIRQPYGKDAKGAATYQQFAVRRSLQEREGLGYRCRGPENNAQWAGVQPIWDHR